MAKKAVSDDFKMFSDKLKNLMKARNKKQQDLADVLGVKRQTISLYMNGQSKPDAEQLKIIAQFFNVSADWLLGLTDISTKDMDVRTICEFTGLSDQAILKLHDLKEMRYISLFISFLVSQKGIKILEKNIERAITAGIAFNLCPVNETGRIPFHEIQDMSEEEYKTWKELAYGTIFNSEKAIDDSLAEGGFVKISLDEAAELFSEKASGYLNGVVNAFISDVINSVN